MHSRRSFHPRALLLPLVCALALTAGCGSDATPGGAGGSSSTSSVTGAGGSTGSTSSGVGGAGGSTTTSATGSTGSGTTTATTGGNGGNRGEGGNGGEGGDTVILSGDGACDCTVAGGTESASLPGGILAAIAAAALGLRRRRARR